MVSDSIDEVGLDIEGITQRLGEAARSTERAVLAIGKLLDQFIQLSLNETLSASESSDDHGINVANEITSIMTATSEFTSNTRDFLGRQVQFAKSANEACRCIFSCADTVAALMRKSHLLAININIEASRLKGEHRIFKVIGEEMSGFSNDVRSANSKIFQALKQLSDSLPQLEGEATDMDSRAADFSNDLGMQLDMVQNHIAELRKAKIAAEKTTISKNKRIVELANMALSKLQFQDPLSQELMSISAEMKAFENGTQSTYRLSDSIVDDGTIDGPDLDSGDVTLF
jgi:hypothetical protein